MSEAVDGVDRRSVLKAGAWAAPVVLIAAASPTAMASVPRSTLWFIGPWSWHPGDGSGYFGVNVHVDGPSPDAQPNPVVNLMVTLSVPADAGTGGAAAVVVVGDTVWDVTAGGVPSGTDPYVYSFVCAEAVPLYGNVSQNLNFRIPVLTGVNGGYTVSFVASATGVETIAKSHIASNRTTPPDPLPTVP